MSRTAKYCAFVGSMLLAMGLCAASPRAQEPGLTGTTIKIGVLGSLTGPLAIFGTGNLAGATIAFEDANAAGGINGRKIEWVSLDDEFRRRKRSRRSSGSSIKKRCSPCSALPPAR